MNKPLPGRLGRLAVALLTRWRPGGVVVPAVPRGQWFVVVTPAARWRRLIVAAGPRPSAGRRRVVPRVQPPWGRPLVPRGRRVVVAVVLGGALPGQLGRTELLAVRTGRPRPRVVRHTRAEINMSILQYSFTVWVNVGQCKVELYGHLERSLPFNDKFWWCVSLTCPYIHNSLRRPPSLYGHLCVLQRFLLICGVNVNLHWAKANAKVNFSLRPLSLLNVTIKLESLWTDGKRCRFPFCFNINDFLLGQHHKGSFITRESESKGMLLPNWSMDNPMLIEQGHSSRKKVVFHVRFSSV